VLNRTFPKSVRFLMLAWRFLPYFDGSAARLTVGNALIKNHMTVTVREMRPADARAFLEVHHAAVRGIAVKDYPAAVIEAWAPLPITDEHVVGVLANPDREYRLIAELGSRVVGIGALVLASAELRACYVEPGADRKGIGSIIVLEIERIARQHGLKTLDLDASVTAEQFYASHGYGVRERSEHILQNGQRMACIRMHKALSSPRF